MTGENSVFEIDPLISIVMPVYNVERLWLKKAIDSVLQQNYKNWELCIVDDASTHPYIRKTLESYWQSESKIKVKYLEANQGIASASNAGLALACGKYVAFMDNDDELCRDSLSEVIKLLRKEPDIDLIYTDEDKIDLEENCSAPVIKPGWSPQLFLTYNYLCHLVVCRKEIIDLAGGFREGFDGSQDYELLLRVTELTDKIVHIPKVLYHWRKVAGSAAHRIDAKDYAFENSKKALREAMERRGIDALVSDTRSVGKFKVKIKRRSLSQLMKAFKSLCRFKTGLVFKAVQGSFQQKTRKLCTHNQKMRESYSDFLVTKERAGVSMLHPEDLYGSGPPNWDIHPEMLAIITRYAGKRILDVGCGTGIYCRELNERGYNCIGVDADRECHDLARKQTNSLMMRAEELGFADKSFDTVIMLEVLEHIEDPYSALKEIVRVTRRNLILSVPSLEPLADCVAHNVVMHHLVEVTHLNFFTKPMLERFLRMYFPYVTVSEFGAFFQVSGKKLFYHLSAVASFQPIPEKAT